MAMKNPTPRDLALYSALIVLGICFLILLIFSIALNIKWWVVLIVCISVFLSSYIVFLYALRRFIYRKIKIIYKSIHRLKRAKGDIINPNMDLRNHIIDEVEREVITWARSQKKEIDDLKEMEEYRRNFLGNISHELKTPIFNIQGYLYTLIDGGLENAVITEKYLNRAANNVERLNTIVQDLERISKLESGKMELDFQRFDVYSLAREVYDDLDISAEEKEIELRFKEGSSRPFHVNADRESIRQVLTNLVSNSIKYGISKGHTRVGFYDMGNQILIEVSDNGIGVTEEHIPHLFERFYRVDKGRSRDSGGTGLGLSIVKHIIEAHDQTINVRSRADEGSTFGFTLEKSKG